MYLNSIVLVLSVAVNYAESANILAVMPTPFFSHQRLYRPLWKELAKLGHNVTLITTDPMEGNITNLTQLDISGTYDVMKKSNITKILSRNGGNLEMFGEAFKTIKDLVNYQFTHQDVQGIMTLPEGSFDIVIAEVFAPFYLIYGWKLNCPTIGLLPLDGHPLVHDILGNPTHPTLYPDFNLPFHTNLTFFQRSLSTFLMISFRVFSVIVETPVNRMLRNYFGDLPPLMECFRNVSLIFINANPIFFHNRPITPATINLGGGLIHLEEPKPLPEDLQQYLDSAEKGFILLSFGTTVQGHQLDDDVRNIFLETFKDLPYKILWKYENETISNKPENVKIAKWLPQQDILRHKNIKLFITHGGLQSMEEALYNHVPMIGIAFFGDQFNNVNRMAEHKFGIKISLDELTRDKLTDAILEIIDSRRFKENIIKTADIAFDQPMSGLEKAVWWIEYVIRHQGARHLRSPIVDATFFEYYMIDVVLFLISIILVGCYATYKTISVLYLLIKFLVGNQKIKPKTL